MSVVDNSDFKPSIAIAVLGIDPGEEFVAMIGPIIEVHILISLVNAALWLECFEIG